MIKEILTVKTKETKVQVLAVEFSQSVPLGKWFVLPTNKMELIAPISLDYDGWQKSEVLRTVFGLGKAPSLRLFTSFPLSTFRLCGESHISPPPHNPHKVHRFSPAPKHTAPLCTSPLSAETSPGPASFHFCFRAQLSITSFSAFLWPWAPLSSTPTMPSSS